mgnify:CR=1 FL=1
MSMLCSSCQETSKGAGCTIKGVKNIHLGPTLPRFLSPNVGKVLVENFGISGIGTVEDDQELFLQEA